ncbi:MAG TPA: CSLREA domain-containing protein [Alphaproteobacteria bacterium]|nr:CSLREA domain-containing protein [Alphaproteobacteria bacterium]
MRNRGPKLVWQLVVEVVVLAEVLAISFGISMRVGPAAEAATFTVNSAVDAVDANPGDGVGETAPGNGVCTLRAAIIETNALTGADEIISSSGTYTLAIPGIDERQAFTGALNIVDDSTIPSTGVATTIVVTNDGSSEAVVSLPADVVG